MAATIDQLLPVASDRTKRDAMVANHFPSSPPAGFEGDFKGITDTTGFTVKTITSADALATEMNNAGPADKLVLECAWNGNSQSAQRIFGYPASGLTANSSVDWGYDRPAGAILIRPASGYSPIYESTYSSGVIDIVGFSKLHIENMTFEAPAFKFGITSTYPCLAMVAMLNNTFQNGSSSDNGTVNIGNLRVMHAAGNTFTGCDAGFLGGANYFRSWDNTFNSMADNDVHGIRGAAFSSWTVHAWVAGAIVHNMSGRKATSGLHCDFLQIGNGADSHVGYEVLAECNIFHLDRGGSMQGTQGFFGSDATSQDGDWLVHNNIGLISAYHAASLYDPNDNMDKVVTKNLFLRSATPSDTQDSYPWIQGTRVSVGTGTLTSRDNYAAAFNTGNVSGESFTGSQVVSPRTSATSPNRYVDVITGNGTFGTDPTTGYLTYTSPDAGQTSALVAKQAIADFAKPLAGWETNGGPVDPAQWPTGDYAALGSGGGGGTPPTFGNGTSGTINVTVG